MSTRPMTVHGVKIPQPALDAARTWMARSGATKFDASEVATQLRCAGVPWDARSSSGGPRQHIACEAANRLLQIERKAGRIAFARGVWQAVREKVES